MIIQSIAGLGAATFTALSWNWIKKTGGFIEAQAGSMEKQTIAMMEQAEISRKLLEIEFQRESQSTKVSAYLTGEVLQKITSSSPMLPHYSWGSRVSVMIDNQSEQPITEVVARMQTRVSVINPRILKFVEDIPIATIAARSVKSVDISGYFHIQGGTPLDKIDFAATNRFEAEKLARQAEIEYVVSVVFKDFKGAVWERSPIDLEVKGLDSTFAKNLYENALRKISEFTNL